MWWTIYLTHVNSNFLICHPVYHMSAIDCKSTIFKLWHYCTILHIYTKLVSSQQFSVNISSCIYVIFICFLILFALFTFLKGHNPETSIFKEHTPGTLNGITVISRIICILLPWFLFEASCSQIWHLFSTCLSATFHLIKNKSMGNVHS